MAQQLQSYTIPAPGFWGVNFQDSPVNMQPEFALRLNNCVIDSSGRVAARKGWSKVNTSLNTQLSTSNVECLGELIENSGTSTILAAGGGYLFRLSGSSLVTLTYGGGGSAPTISANNWQFCHMNGVAIFWQRGYDPLIYEPAVSTTTFRRLNERSGYVGTVGQCNAAIASYGRVWAADTIADKNTVIWSDLLAPHVWSTGTAGSLDVRQVWPNGSDEIIALAAHNGFLIIFGKRQILIYSGAENPANMRLADSVDTIGCVARDSIQNIGTDLLFLSHLGVHSFGRVLQEKSLPISDISHNVRDEVQEHLSAETAANIKSVYSDVNAFYLLTFPTAAEVYVFDLRTKLENGSARMTTWDSNVPKAFLSTTGRKLYFGKAGYIGQYGTYLDNNLTYRMAYLSPHIDFGKPINITILKNILITTVSLQQNAVCKWSFDFLHNFLAQSFTINKGTVNTALYNVSEYNTTAEYTTPIAAVISNIDGRGEGKTMQVGFEIQIDGYALSLQKIDILAKEGRLK